MTASNRDRVRTFSGKHKRIVRWKVGIYFLSSVVLLSTQFLIAYWDLHKAWDVLLSLLLAHSVVMLTDAVCEAFDDEEPNWSNMVVGFLLPIEPRGVSSVVMMIGLFLAVATAIQIRSCAGPTEPRNRATESKSILEGNQNQIPVQGTGENSTLTDH